MISLHNLNELSIALHYHDWYVIRVLVYMVLQDISKALPRKPVASADALTAMVTAQLTELHVVSVAI